MTRVFRYFFCVAENSADLRIFEDRRVKLHGVLGLTIEPQEWSNFLHILFRFVHVSNERTEAVRTRIFNKEMN